MNIQPAPINQPMYQQAGVITPPMTSLWALWFSKLSGLWTESDVSRYAIHTGNYTLKPSDGGIVQVFTATATCTMPSPATFPDGWQTVIWNQCATALTVTLSGFTCEGTGLEQNKACGVILVSGEAFAAGGIT